MGALSQLIQLKRQEETQGVLNSLAGPRFIIDQYEKDPLSVEPAAVDYAISSIREIGNAQSGFGAGQAAGGKGGKGGKGGGLGDLFANIATLGVYGVRKKELSRREGLRQAESDVKTKAPAKIFTTPEERQAISLRLMEAEAQEKLKINQRQYEQEYDRLTKSGIDPKRAAEEANALASGHAAPSAGASRAQVTRDVQRPGTDPVTGKDYEGAWTRIMQPDGTEEWLRETARPAAAKPTQQQLLARSFRDSGRAKSEDEANQMAARMTVDLENAKLKLAEARTKAAAASGGQSSFTPQEMSALAHWGVMTGQNPSFGLSANNPDRRMYYKAVADEIAGGGPGVAAETRAGYKGLSGSLTDIQRLRGRVVSFEETARANIARAVMRSRQVGRTGASLINEYLLAGEGKLEDYPELAQFRTDVFTAANEYARVVNSATGNGVSTDTAREEAMRIFNSAMAKGALEGAAQEMQADMDNRVKALDQTIQGLREGLRNEGPGASGATGQPYKIGETVRLKDGKTVTIKKINPDGSFDY